MDKLVKGSPFFGNQRRVGCNSVDQPEAKGLADLFDVCGIQEKLPGSTSRRAPERVHFDAVSPLALRTVPLPRSGNDASLAWPRVTLFGPQNCTACCFRERCRERYLADFLHIVEAPVVDREALADFVDLGSYGSA